MAKVQTWIERVQFQIELVNIFQELAESKPEAYPKSKGRMNKHILKNNKITGGVSHLHPQHSRESKSISNVFSRSLTLSRIT